MRKVLISLREVNVNSRSEMSTFDHAASFIAVVPASGNSN